MFYRADNIFNFLFFDILPSLSDFTSFHMNTSRMAFTKSGDQGSRLSVLLKEASASSVPFVIRLFRSSINGISSMVSLFVLMSSLILSVCAMMLWCLTSD